MKSKIKEIYREVMHGSDEMKLWRERLEKQIEILLEKERGEMDTAEYEMYRERYYEIAMLAEEGGFVLGFRYAVQLMAECGLGE